MIELVKKGKSICADCFNIATGIALLEDDFLTPRSHISFFTSPSDTVLNANASGIIHG